MTPRLPEPGGCVLETTKTTLEGERGARSAERGTGNSLPFRAPSYALRAGRLYCICRSPAAGRLDIMPSLERKILDALGRPDYQPVAADELARQLGITKKRLSE